MTLRHGVMNSCGVNLLVGGEFTSDSVVVKKEHDYNDHRAHQRHFMPIQKLSFCHRFLRHGILTGAPLSSGQPKDSEYQRGRDEHDEANQDRPSPLLFHARHCNRSTHA
jgi:hypothetical protein